MQTTETAPEQLWAPADDMAAASRMARLMADVADREGLALDDFEDLWAWSVARPARPICW